MIAAFPVGSVVSQIMLAVLFYVMITTVAVLFRWRARDSLHRAPARERELLVGEIPAGGFAAILPAILAGGRTRISF